MLRKVQCLCQTGYRIQWSIPRTGPADPMTCKMQFSIMVSDDSAFSSAIRSHGRHFRGNVFFGIRNSEFPMNGTVSSDRYATAVRHYWPVKQFMP